MAWHETVQSGPYSAMVSFFASNRELHTKKIDYSWHIKQQLARCQYYLNESMHNTLEGVTIKRRCGFGGLKEDQHTDTQTD